ncbi:uncharacterized protein LOC104887914 [Beta vulgaris subsp. vulgaris]|uniref:uncharacterized protein LOC104887914 n=1 Tax=Beta vulgaris subsp. vulgaris TaxID=3555 RepID=UPI002546654A|nr:uncharacterized protein LOC104887914 [Beta vulgaris subsp. vulgaris]
MLPILVGMVQQQIHLAGSVNSKKAIQKEAEEEEEEGEVRMVINNTPFVSKYILHSSQNICYHDKMLNEIVNYIGLHWYVFLCWVVDQQPAPRTRGVSVQEKRFSTGSDSPLPLESPSRKRSDKPKGSRRANSASAADSPRRSSTSTENRTKHQQQQLSAAEGDTTTAGPKTSTRRKKPKSGSSSGQSSSKTSIKPKSTGPSSDTSQYSDPGTGRRKGKDTCQSSVLKISSEQEDQKALDDISRGIQAM